MSVGHALCHVTAPLQCCLSSPRGLVLAAIKEDCHPLLQGLRHAAGKYKDVWARSGATVARRCQRLMFGFA